MLEQIVQDTGMEVTFTFNHLVYHLLIIKVVEDMTTVIVATPPNYSPNSEISTYFAQYGTVNVTEHCKYSEKFKYRNAFTRRRTIIIRP